MLVLISVRILHWLSIETTFIIELNVKSKSHSQISHLQLAPEMSSFTHIAANNLFRRLVSNFGQSSCAITDRYVLSQSDGATT